MTDRKMDPRSSKRLLALALSVATVGAVVGACSGATTSPVASTAATQAPVTPAPATTAPSEAVASDAAPSAAPDLTGKNVVFVSFGGAYQEAEDNAWLKPFAAATGATVLQDSPPDYSKIKAMVDAGQVTWDVVDVEGEFGLDRDGAILEPIDHSVVPKDGLSAGATDYRVPFMTYSSVLGYNSQALKGKVPTSWKDFFDLKNFPGKRGVPTDAHDGLFEAALLADGVPPDQIYPIDVDRALAKLATIKDALVFTTSSAQKQDLLSTGETVMGFIGNGRAYAAKKDGHPVDVAWDGHVDFADYLVVPKGSPNKDAAMALIAYVVSAANNANLSKFISYSPANTGAQLPSGVAADELTSNYADLPHVVFDDEWWSANYDDVNAKYQAWKQS